MNDVDSGRQPPERQHCDNFSHAQPADGIPGQLRFALRYEPVDLGVYKAAFAHIRQVDLERWVESQPNGIFARRAWYLYELLTQATLDVPDLTSGPYIDLLDKDLHIDGPSTRIRRQRVFDNLLGNKDYCPLIPRTEKLAADLTKNFTERTHALVSAIEPAAIPIQQVRAGWRGHSKEDSSVHL